MTPPPPFTPEQLLEHAQSLRALARRLLLDENAAEDVVQDAWVLALERPPAERERIGGWLHTVVHSLVMKRRRGERRRGHRERVAAQPEQQDSTLDSLLSAAQCKRLIDAVVALDEPYRTAISMRYLDDLPPREIATRLGVPRNTVRARLQRGLAQLRQSLDEDSEGGRTGWAPAMLAFAELKPDRLAVPVAAATSSGTLGVLTMASVGKWAVGVMAVVLLGVGIVEVMGSEDEALSSVDVRRETVSRDDGELTAALAPNESSERFELDSVAEIDTTGLEVAAPPDWATRSRFPFELRGIVVDQWGRPARSESVHIAVDGQRFNTFHNTGPDGRFVIEFDGARASLDVRLYVRTYGRSTSGLRTYRMVSGEPRIVHIDLKEIEHESLDPRGTANYVGPLGSAPGLKAAPEANVRFYTYSGLDVGLPEEEFFDSEESSMDDSRLSLTEMDSTRLFGVVQAADGSPASGALVNANLEGESWGHWVQTDKRGEWHLEGLDPGTYTLRAGGDEFGLATHTVDVSKGEDHAWNAFLDRGRELRGRVVSPDGSGGVFLVRAEATDPNIEWSDTALSDDVGRFAMPNVLPMTVRVSVFDFEGNPFGVPVHVEGGLVAAGGEHEILLAREELLLGALSFSLTNADGVFVPNAEARLFHLDTGHGVFMKPSALEDEVGHYFAAGLPAGTYLLEVNSPPLGWITQPRITLQAGQELELGQLAFERPGLLVANVAANDLKHANNWSIVQLGELVDSYAWQGWPLSPWEWAELEAPDWVKVQLPRGKYALSVRAKSTGEAWFPFDVESGGLTTLDLPLALLTEVKLRFAGGRRPEGLEKMGLLISDADSGAQVLKASVDGTSREFDLMLLPGSYEVRLLGESEPLATGAFEVEAATPRTVKLDLR